MGLVALALGAVAARSAALASPAAAAKPIRAGEPVVTSTNQGSATAPISVPVVETTSATSSAASGTVNPARLGTTAAV